MSGRGNYRGATAQPPLDRVIDQIVYGQFHATRQRAAKEALERDFRAGELSA